MCGSKEREADLDYALGGKLGKSQMESTYETQTGLLEQSLSFGGECPQNKARETCSPSGPTSLQIIWSRTAFTGRCEKDPLQKSLVGKENGRDAFQLSQAEEDDLPRPSTS